MGKLKQRKQPLTIREIQNKIKHVNELCKEPIRKLNESDIIPSCPECKSNKNAKCMGSNNGIRKLACFGHDKVVNYSTTTSYEAIEIYRDLIIENLCVFACTNSTVGGIMNYNNSSKYFIELAEEALYDYIMQNNIDKEVTFNEKEEIATIFLDLSGSGLARNKAIILARYGKNYIFKIVTTSNHLSSYELISTIKEKFEFSENSDLVFVTDGEGCFIDPIRDFFPDSYHIRQFHKDTCRGIIYMHFNHDESDYTLRCLWNTVLNDKKAPESVIKQRELKAKKKLDKKERKNKVEYTKLDPDVVLWDKLVRNPRGVRRVIKETNEEKDDPSIVSEQKDTQNEFKIDENTSELGQKENESKKKNTSPYDRAKEIFRGSAEDAKNHEIMKNCFFILISIFGGCYITSNAVETVFNLKSRLKAHRVVKTGKRLIVCVIYVYLYLRNKSKKWLRDFFGSKVITYDFIRNNVLYGSDVQKNNVREKKSSFLDTINTAIEKDLRLVIRYRDRLKRYSTRLITPKEVVTNNYNNISLLKSYCHKRNEERTFCVERMKHVAIYDPNPLVM